MASIVGSGHPLGAVLAVLLQAVGFEARFLGAPDLEGLDGALAGFRLVVLCPDSGIGEESGYGLLPTRMPVLELIRDGSEDGRLRENSVARRCRVEVLEARIRAALQPEAGGCA